MHHRWIATSTIICNPEVPLDIAERQDVGNGIRMIPDRAIALEFPHVCDADCSGIAHDLHGELNWPDSGQQVAVSKHANG